MAKRIIRTVRWNKGRWTTEGFSFGMLPKKYAIQCVRQDCRALYLDGHLAQLRVYNKNGRIAFENTYGKDPKRRKG